MSKSLYTTIIESTAPTTSTVGVVGQWYIHQDVANDICDLYLCKKVTTSGSTTTYTWDKQGGGGGGDYLSATNPVGTGSMSMNRESGSSIGANSSTFGTNCRATEPNSFASGDSCSATQRGAKAEGQATTASGFYSHAEGGGTESKGDYQHVSGKYNIVDNDSTYAEIIGNGGNNSNRSNARTLDWSGNEMIAGNLRAAGLTDGTTTKTMTEVLAGGGSSGKYLHVIQYGSPFTGQIFAILNTSTPYTNSTFNALITDLTAAGYTSSNMGLIVIKPTNTIDNKVSNNVAKAWVENNQIRYQEVTGSFQTQDITINNTEYSLFKKLTYLNTTGSISSIGTDTVIAL